MIKNIHKKLLIGMASCDLLEKITINCNLRDAVIHGAKVNAGELFIVFQDYNRAIEADITNKVRMIIYCNDIYNMGCPNINICWRLSWNICGRTKIVIYQFTKDAS